MKNIKTKSILLILIPLVLVAAVFVGMGYLGRNAVYEYTVEYDENVLFPAKYKINSTGIRDARGILSGYDVLQIYADKELTEKISVVDSQTIKAGEDPNKMNVQTVEFGYSTRMKEVFYFCT